MEMSESRANLQRALATLRAIRERYVTGHKAHPDARSYSVQVALGSADLFWLTATIEAVERAIDLTEAATRARSET